eukprot:6477593-Pyramimonas_sp.AAC.1
MIRKASAQGCRQAVAKKLILKQVCATVEEPARSMPRRVMHGTFMGSYSLLRDAFLAIEHDQIEKFLEAAKK